MALAALKNLKYKGRNYKRGEVLTPPPDPTLANMLIRGRFAFDNSTTTVDTRPQGTGRGRRPLVKG